MKIWANQSSILDLMMIIVNFISFFCCRFSSFTLISFNNCLNLFHLLLVPTHLTVARMHIFDSLSLSISLAPFPSLGFSSSDWIHISGLIRLIQFEILSIRSPDNLYKKTQDAHIIHNTQHTTIQQPIQSIFGFYDFSILFFILLFFLVIFMAFLLFFSFLKTHGGYNSRTYIARWAIDHR